MTRESEIEKYLVAQVKHAGGEVRKVKWEGRRGAPDRVVFLHGARFVELKRPGGEPEEHQRREHRRMAEQGVFVWVLDDFEEVDAFIDAVLIAGAQNE